MATENDYSEFVEPAASESCTKEPRHFECKSISIPTSNTWIKRSCSSRRIQWLHLDLREKRVFIYRCATRVDLRCLGGDSGTERENENGLSHAGISIDGITIGNRLGVSSNSLVFIHFFPIPFFFRDSVDLILAERNDARRRRCRRQCMPFIG